VERAIAGPVLEVDGVGSPDDAGLPVDLAKSPVNRAVMVTATTPVTAPDVTAPLRRSPADRFARWALRVQDPADGQDVHNIFSASMALSGTRCLLSYIVLPLLTPWLGALPFIGPAIGIPVGVLALVFDVRAMRRFFQADHRWRWVAAFVYLAVMIMVATLVFRDISHLV
jgi:hypothetical protein